MNTKYVNDKIISPSFKIFDYLITTSVKKRNSFQILLYVYSDIHLLAV